MIFKAWYNMYYKLTGGMDMNINKLKDAESKFMMDYPEGFMDPEMIKIGKKHKIEKMTKDAQEFFAIEAFDDTPLVVEHFYKIVSRSSMVSMFEKPKFRDAVQVMSLAEKEMLAQGLKEVLHGDEEKGFNLMLDVLLIYKLAKWPLMTVCQAYFRPLEEIFIKPTTAKGVIKYFELEGLQYKPRPSYAFYKAYRDVINKMKEEVNSSLAPSNAAFSGFLMMMMEN